MQGEWCYTEIAMFLESFLASITFSMEAIWPQEWVNERARSTIPPSLAAQGNNDMKGNLRKILNITNSKIVYNYSKVEKILKGSLDLIPSPSVKIQIMAGKVCLRCKGKILLGIVNKLLKTKSLLTTPSNVLPIHLKQTFPPIIWILLKVKVMGLNPGYPLKKFCLNSNTFKTMT